MVFNHKTTIYITVKFRHNALYFDLASESCYVRYSSFLAKKSPSWRIENLEKSNRTYKLYTL